MRSSFGIAALSLKASVFVLLAAAGPAGAVFAPPAFVTGPTPLATAAAELRSFQQWDVFGQPAGPNTPLTNDVNPFGTASAFDANSGSTASGHSGSFVTSGGNLYSPVGIIKPRAVVPLADVAGNVERVSVDLQIAPGSQTINAADFTANGLPTAALADYVFTDNTDAASGTQRYRYAFSLPDTATLRLDWGWGVTSASLDVLAIETHSVAVPEPVGLAAVGVAGAALLRRRRV